MNKNDRRELEKARIYAAMGEPGIAARTVAAIYNAGSRAAQRECAVLAAELSLPVALFNGCLLEVVA